MKRRSEIVFSPRPQGNTISITWWAALQDCRLRYFLTPNSRFLFREKMGEKRNVSKLQHARGDFIEDASYKFQMFIE